MAEQQPIRRRKGDQQNETGQMPDQRPKRFKKHETVNLIRLKQLAKMNILNPDQNEKTAGANQRAEDFALDLPLLVDESARDIKILNAKAAIEQQQLDSIFYPYRPHRLHLSTRFGLLFYNNKIVSPENMRTTNIAMLHHGHISAAKMDHLAEAFWWPGMHREIQEKAESCPSCRAAGENITTQIPSTKKKQSRNFDRTESGNSIGLRRSNQIEDTRRCIYFSSH